MCACVSEVIEYDRCAVYVNDVLNIGKYPSMRKVSTRYILLAKTSDRIVIHIYIYYIHSQGLTVSSDTFILQLIL